MDNILPPSLTKTWYSKALQHESPLVSFLASIFLLASLQKAAQILAVIAESSSRLEEVPTVGRWASLGTRLREHLRTILPDPQTIVALMQKTAVVVSAPVVKKPSRKSSSKKVVVEKEEEEKDDDVVGRHLRTNVALRLLWSYHRVVPSLIATLRFDFAKLPQAHVARTDVEGIRAISSAYALRLAAIHSSTLIWSRPGMSHISSTLFCDASNLVDILTRRGSLQEYFSTALSTLPYSFHSFQSTTSPLDLRSSLIDSHSLRREFRRSINLARRFTYSNSNRHRNVVL